MLTSVAIVEDNLEFLNRFSQIIDEHPSLSLAGRASTGLEGMALINSTKADVFLIDLGLPDMNGTSLIRHAVTTYPDCQVMVITVFEDDAHVITSIEAGATGYVMKDCSPTELANCIQTLRSGGSPLSPIIANRILKRLVRNSLEHGATETPDQLNPSVLLTERESQILKLLSTGLSLKEIGESLSISVHTVAHHNRSIYSKLAVRSRGEAVYEAKKKGILRF